MRVVQGGHFWQFADRFDHFSSYRNYRWGDSSIAFLAQTWPQKRSQVPNFLGGACRQTPLACSHTGGTEMSHTTQQSVCTVRTPLGVDWKIL